MLIFAASESKADMQAAVWRIPSEYISTDDTSSHPSLQLVTHLDSTDYGDVKWSEFIGFQDTMNI